MHNLPVKNALLLLVAWFASSLALAEPAPSTPQQRAAAEEFGAQIERAFNDRNRNAVAGLVDMRALAMRSADLQGLTGRSRDEFVRDTELAGPDQLVSSYFKALDTSKGKVRFMRATNQFPPRSLVRFDLGDQGFSYCEFIVATNPEGRTRAVDWWQLSTGELVSVTMSSLAQLGTNRNPGMLERVFGIKHDEALAAQFDKLRAYQRSGRYSEALEVLKQMPEPAASNRSVLFLRVSMATFANRTDEYGIALEKLAEHHANDPAASFILLGYHFKRQDWPKAIAAIDTMEKRVGNDGVTRLLRASAYSQADDVPSALKYAEESIGLESGLLDSHDMRAALLIRSARYSDAIAAYKGIESRFGLKFTRDNFTAEPSYASFVKSAAFRDWFPK